MKFAAFLLVILVCCSCNVEITNWIKIPELNNTTRLSDSNAVSLTTTTNTKCATECSNDASCMSFSYHTANQQCLVYSILVTNDTAGLIHEDGWRTYHLDWDTCPYDLGYVYNRALDWCYRLETNDMRNRDGARTYCYNQGAILAKVDSLPKQLHMAAFLGSKGAEHVYIGGISETENGQFHYDDGAAVSFTHWAVGEPKSMTYIKMVHDEDNYRWRNGDGTRLWGFLCEFEL